MSSIANQPTSVKSSYEQQLKDPRWQKRRLQILERDEWMCQYCFDDHNTLHVHHKTYLSNTNPWDYPDELLVTLCEDCHEKESSLTNKANITLIKSFHEQFSNDSIIELCDAVHKMTVMKQQDVTASILCWVLSDNKIQKHLVEAFFEHLAIQNRKKGHLK